MAKKTYVLDTSVYLTDSNAIRSFQTNDIVIPLKVLEEIDKHKNRQDGVGQNARNSIRMLDELRSHGSLHKGVRIERGLGLMRVGKIDVSRLPADMDKAQADNQIISVALNEQAAFPKRKVILVSRDINMRVKCDSLGMACEDYINGQIVKNLDVIYPGVETLLVDDEFIDSFYDGKEVFLDQEQHNLSPNQFVILISSSNEKKTALCRYRSNEVPVSAINKPKKGVWGLRPRNKEQAFALDILTDPEVQVISLIGKAGSGKTLLAIAAGLEQTLESETYSRVIVTRPVEPLGKDIGFLPGSMEEKMAPWLKPIQDNLAYLFGNDKMAMSMYFERGKIEVEALTYIRGRSINNAFIIIDESQNLSHHELKTIVTRVGENTKIVFTGDIEQIDNIYLNEISNGLTYVVEKFKDYPLAGHMTLIKGERSKVATLAAKIL